MIEPPTRAQVREWMRQLAAGELTQREASDAVWAWTSVEGMDAIEDEVVLRSVILLGGADLMDSPTTYLYGPGDFVAWLDELDAALDDEPT